MRCARGGAEGGLCRRRVIEVTLQVDDLGAGDGQLVAFSEGGEAAQPFKPLDKPIDAYVAALIDHLDVNS
jgi:ethanolamine utilization protein EutN